MQQPATGETDKIVELFGSYFKIRRNIIFERARFNRRNQLPSETAEQYIMELYSLAANCNYGAMEQKIIIDQLVVGIRNQALSKTLQLDTDLTLNKAKHAIRQQESVQEQQSILNRRDATFASMDSIRRNYRS